MSKVNNISDKSEVLNAVDAMASVLGGQVIDQWDSEQADKDFVHGGIRHLENVEVEFSNFNSVHGGIRHLERHTYRQLDVW